MRNCTCQHCICYAFFKPHSTEKKKLWAVHQFGHRCLGSEFASVFPPTEWKCQCPDSRWWTGTLVAMMGGKAVRMQDTILWQGGEARGKPGFVPAWSSGSNLISDWWDPPCQQPQIPKGWQWLCQPSSLGQPNSSPLSALLSLRGHAPGASVIHDTLLTSLPEAGDPSVVHLPLWAREFDYATVSLLSHFISEVMKTVPDYHASVSCIRDASTRLKYHFQCAGEWCVFHFFVLCIPCLYCWVQKLAWKDRVGFREWLADR